MKLVTHDFPEDLEHLYILAIGDFHLGDRLFNEERLQDFLDWAIKEDAYLILGGDLINNALKDSISDCYTQTISPSEQLERATDIFRPFKERILGAVAGNHEFRSIRNCNFDPAGELVYRLGGQELAKKIYDPDGIAIIIRIGKSGHSHGKIIYTLYVTHGVGSGKRVGGRANNLDDMSNIVDVDIYINFHTHQEIAFNYDYFRIDETHNKLSLVKKSYVKGGSFLDWGGYAERKGYKPGHVGAPRIRLNGTRKDCHITL
jgi:predicted phosphodiesterase